MNSFIKRIIDRIVVTAAGRNFIRAESFYRFKARRHGVQFLGIFERHQLALFQDPVTGSSFAVKQGEPVETGIRRVRDRFGVTA